MLKGSSFDHGDILISLLAISSGDFTTFSPKALWDFHNFWILNPPCQRSTLSFASLSYSLERHFYFYTNYVSFPSGSPSFYHHWRVNEREENYYYSFIIFLQHCIIIISWLKYLYGTLLSVRENNIEDMIGL